MEMKWQFYNSLNSFKGNLQRGTLQLSELLGNITKYGEQLASLRRVISQWNEEEEDGDAAPLVGWSDTTGSDDLGEDEGQPSEEALLDLFDKLAEDTQVATDRVGSALQALQVISEELEELRRKVAKPVDPPPFFTHLHGMYITGARLERMVSEKWAEKTRDARLGTPHGPIRRVRVSTRPPQKSRRKQELARKTTNRAIVALDAPRWRSFQTLNTAATGIYKEVWAANNYTAPTGRRGAHGRLLLFVDVPVPLAICAKGLSRLFMPSDTEQIPSNLGPRHHTLPISLKETDTSALLDACDSSLKRETIDLPTLAMSQDSPSETRHGKAQAERTVAKTNGKEAERLTDNEDRRYPRDDGGDPSLAISMAKLVSMLTPMVDNPPLLHRPQDQANVSFTPEQLIEAARLLQNIGGLPDNRYSGACIPFTSPKDLR
ncbi:hypothetical protein NMY22_g5056 [Coprinellus aureogranulatus]|nr:hypothetical protein NMY22_g5056 [Coprinellus aureogranulatus]